MTELTMVTVTSLGESISQVLKNEKDIQTDHTLLSDLDVYLNNYVLEFNKANLNSNVKCASVKVYYEDQLINEYVANA